LRNIKHLEVIMPKLNIEDLDKITAKVRKATVLREGAGSAKVTVHMGTCGIAAGARAIMTAFMDEIEKSGSDDIILTSSGCAGLCSQEPMATVELKGEAPVKYGNLTADAVVRVMKEHVAEGNPLKDLAIASGSESMS
jgi:NADP-reducing hydrogenase subunit HndB